MRSTIRPHVSRKRRAEAADSSSTRRADPTEHNDAQTDEPGPGKGVGLFPMGPHRTSTRGAVDPAHGRARLRSCGPSGGPAPAAGGSADSRTALRRNDLAAVPGTTPGNCRHPQLQTRAFVGSSADASGDESGAAAARRDRRAMRPAGWPHWRAGPARTDRSVSSSLVRSSCRPSWRAYICNSQPPSARRQLPTTPELTRSIGIRAVSGPFAQFRALFCPLCSRKAHFRAVSRPIRALLAQFPSGA